MPDPDTALTAELRLAIGSWLVFRMAELQPGADEHLVSLGEIADASDLPRHADEARQLWVELLGRWRALRASARAAELDSVDVQLAVVVVCLDAHPTLATLRRLTTPSAHFDARIAARLLTLDPGIRLVAGAPLLRAGTLRGLHRAELRTLPNHIATQALRVSALDAESARVNCVATQSASTDSTRVAGPS